MNKKSFKEICAETALSIDRAGLLAFYAIDTDDFVTAFSDLLLCFKQKFAEYLYAYNHMHPDDERLGKEDRNPELDQKLEKISVYYKAACDVLDIKFVRSFDPEKGVNGTPFFTYLFAVTERKARSDLKTAAIADTRSGISGMSREDSRLLRAALKYFESIGEPTDAQLVAVADVLDCTPEKLRLIWMQNRNSNAESLDVGFENDEGDYTSLYDKLSDKEDDLPARNEVLEEQFMLLDSLISYTRPADMKKADAPFELTKTEKLRFPLLFTNSLILGWIDDIRDNDPDCNNREDVLRTRFEDLNLAARKECYSKYLSVSEEVFDLYILGKREISKGDLSKIYQVDQSGFSGIEDSVREKLALFMKR